MSNNNVVQKHELAAIDIKYDDLKELVNSNSLTKGIRYKITDFRTIYRKPDGCNSSGNELWLTDGRATDPNPSTVEPIIVTAITTNSFAAKATSELYPEDIIYFSFDEDMQVNRGYEIYSAYSKGFIYRRISKNKVDMPFDFRNVKWRRWEVDYDAIMQWNSTSAYETGTIVRNSGTADNKIYLAVRDAPANESPTTTGSKYWLPILDLSKTKYWAFTNWCDGSNKWCIYGSQNTTIPLTGEYRDTFTFSNYDATPELNLDKSSYANNSVLSGYNFIFYSNGGGFYGNTIGNKFYNNTIDKSFYHNTISNYFCYNTINGYFSYNTIGNQFRNNTISDHFSYNTIGNQFRNNITGGSFYNNTIGNEFWDNTAVRTFYYNTIGNRFYHNAIGDIFFDNTIGNYFTNNIVGNSFLNNTICNNFKINTISNDFKCNTVLDGNWGYWEGYDFTSVSEIYNKSYPHIIQLTPTGAIMVTWYNTDGILISLLLPR